MNVHSPENLTEVGIGVKIKCAENEFINVVINPFGIRNAAANILLRQAVNQSVLARSRVDCFTAER